MELCYRNNQKSLFRKYARLVTWFSQTQLGRAYLGVPKDIALMLPNGFIQGDQRGAKATFYTRPVYSPKLSLALAKIDLVSQWLKDFKEAKHLLVWELGMTWRKPVLAHAVMLAETTFNPDADPESTSVDGTITYLEPGDPLTWAVIRAKTTGTAVADSITTDWAPYVQGATESGKWAMFERVIYLFDTSALTAGAIIGTPCNVSLYVKGYSDGFAENQGIRIVTSTPNSNTALITADFDQLGTVGQASDILFTNMSTSAYSDFALNATGRGNISLTSISKFGARIISDAANTEPTWAYEDAVLESYQAGGASEPKLVVTYTPAAGAFMTTKSKFWGGA